MSTSVIGGQFVSISHSGVSLFNQGPFETVIGGSVIDLASAPIPPGEYHLKIAGGLGGVEIYLPKYVELTIDGTSLMGGREVHEGHDIWYKMTHRVKSWLQLDEKIPEHAVENPTPGQRIAIHFTIDAGVGGVDIYRI
jgi:hypothetical protein